MRWLLALILLFVNSVHASYAQDELKIRICEELHTILRDVSVDSCFHGKFKMTAREQGIVDFRWSLNRRLLCTGSVYADNGDITIDGCYR